MAETAMKEVHVNKSLDAIGVGFYNGASFIFPGRPGRSCDEYDPRVRPWYLAAASAPKDIVLILDTSGSMSLHGNLDQQKAAANLVLSTLNLGDYFGVVAFGTGARFVTNPHMMPATMESIEHAQQAVDALSPYGSSDMLTGFEYAFDMLENSIASTANRTSNCKRIIMVMTESDSSIEENVEIENSAEILQTIATRNTAGINAAIFAYTFGSVEPETTNETVLLHNITCEHRGIFQQIGRGGDADSLRNQMNTYFEYLSFGLEETQPVTWVEPYEYATSAGGIWGITVSATVMVAAHPDSVENHTLAGVVFADIPLSALQRITYNYRELLDEIAFNRGASCPTSQIDPCYLESLRMNDDSKCFPAECSSVDVDPNVHSCNPDIYTNEPWCHVFGRRNSLIENSCCATCTGVPRPTTTTLTTTPPPVGTQATKLEAERCRIDCEAMRSGCTTDEGECNSWKEDCDQGCEEIRIREFKEICRDGCDRVRDRECTTFEEQCDRERDQCKEVCERAGAALRGVNWMVVAAETLIVLYIAYI
eukprot:957495_1